jgi:mRNA interferase MazF
MSDPKVKIGDIYWLQLPEGVSHPHVIIQKNAGDTAVICGLSTNMKKLGMPGNVVLEAGEANLTKQSIVDVTKVLIVNNSELGRYVGTLNQQRVVEIQAGIRFLQKSFFANR